MEDLVNSPKHYCSGHIECIDAIKAASSENGFFDYLRGNVMKYLWRANRKGAPLTDIEKAQWYLNKLHDELDARLNPKPTPVVRDFEALYNAELSTSTLLRNRVAKLSEQLAATKKKPAPKKRSR